MTAEMVNNDQIDVEDMSLMGCEAVIVESYATVIASLHVVGKGEFEAECLLKFEGTTNDNKDYRRITLIMSKEDSIILAQDILEGNNYANDLPD